MTPSPLASAALLPRNAGDLAAEAYVYGYPLVLMDVRRRVATATPVLTASRAPINELLHARVCPDHASDALWPELDTLASTAWLELSKEPVVLSVPSLGRRYYVMQLCDAWTNVFASPGSRTTGTAERDFAIVGPYTKGTLPRSVTPIRSPTNTAWLLGRTQLLGPLDQATVHAIQSRYALTPVSAIGGSSVRGHAVLPLAETAVDLATPPVQQVRRMPALVFFRRLAQLMTQNPPADVDNTALARFAALGVISRTPRQRVFDPRDIAAGLAAVLDEGARIGHARIVEAAAAEPETTVNHWRVSTRLGRYGTSYLRRAAAAMVAPGASVPEDALHFHASENSGGQPLIGARRYVLRFRQGQLPPVHACWSVTMYDERQRLVEGYVPRHKLGSRDEWHLASDGSLPIYIQHDHPGASRESNWLPAPAGEFTVIMRLHWPRENALDGEWIPPPITPAP
jgi:hypothetical protein